MNEWKTKLNHWTELVQTWTVLCNIMLLLCMKRGPRDFFTITPEITATIKNTGILQYYNIDLSWRRYLCKKEKGAIGWVSILTLHISASNYNSVLGQKACGLISSLFTGQSLASRQPARLEILANGAVKTNLTLASNMMHLSALF